MWCTQSKHNFTGLWVCMRCSLSHGAWVWVCMQKPGNTAATQQIPLDPLHWGCIPGTSSFLAGSFRGGSGSCELKNELAYHFLRWKRRRWLCPFLDKKNGHIKSFTHCVCVCVYHLYCAKCCDPLGSLCELGIFVWDGGQGSWSWPLFYPVTQNPKLPSCRISRCATQGIG